MCCRTFSFVIMLLLPLAQGICSELIEQNEQDLENPEPPMDWSKPVVSRGFGHESDNPDKQHWISRYKSGQVSYFFGEYQKALETWLPLVEQNYAEAQASVAWLYHSGLGVKKDDSKALALYRKAAAQSNASAQNNIGVFYEKGIVVDKDLAIARKWFKKSAENGYRFAAYNYANFLMQGLGGKQDSQLATIWFQKAADLGVSQAKDKLRLLEARLN